MLTTGLLTLLVLFALPVGSAVAASTTIKVTSTADESIAETGPEPCEGGASGCTLRAAVELADEVGGEVTIKVPAGTYTESRSPSALLVDNFSAVITIIGEGPGKTIIQGATEPHQGHDHVIQVEEGALTVSAVTIRYGSEDEGGGIFVGSSGSIILEETTVTENEAGEGGGIAAQQGAAVTVRKHSQIVDNDAAWGGGVNGLVLSELVVEDSTIANNVAEFDGGGILMEMDPDECDYARASGAAGHVRRDGLFVAENFGNGVIVSQSKIEENIAYNGDGGGIDAIQEYCEEGPGVTANKSAKPDLSLLNPFEPNLIVAQSTIAKNSAEAGEGEQGYRGEGGGIFEATEVEDPIIDSTIAENFASEDGGGVAVAEGAEALVSDTVVDNSVEPPRVETEGRPAVRRDTIEGEQLAGSNLSTSEEFRAVIGLRNTIVAELGGGEVNNCLGDIVSIKEKGGYNLDYPSSSVEGASFDTCGMNAEEQDLVNVNPDFKGGLQNNGGPTNTIALEPSSPAVGFVPVKEDCEQEGTGPALPNELDEVKPVDQRGEKRPGIKGKECDIGAYEYQEPPKVEEPKKEEKKEEAKKEEAKKEEAKPTSQPEVKAEVKAAKISHPVQCKSKRDIIIHIQHVKQFGIISAVVSIDGKHKRTLTGNSLKTAIDLRGLPKGTFTVEIVAHTRSGQTLYGKRVYHTCHTKLPGHAHLRL